jgi:hypothetical protein
MVFVFVMSWCTHVSKGTLSAISLSNQALVSPDRSKPTVRLSLFPHRVWIQLRNRGPFRDMFIKDGGDVPLSDLGIPGIVGIDDNRRTLLARTEAARRAYQYFPWWDRTLHQPHVERH